MKTDETCFAQDTQHCYASILYSTLDVNTTLNAHVIRKFALAEPSCVLTDQVSDSTNGQIEATYTCQGVTLQADGLHFAKCGNDGNIIIPASV